MKWRIGLAVLVVAAALPVGIVGADAFLTINDGNFALTVDDFTFPSLSYSGAIQTILDRYPDTPWVNEDDRFTKAGWNVQIAGDTAFGNLSGWCQDTGTGITMIEPEQFAMRLLAADIVALEGQVAGTPITDSASYNSVKSSLGNDLGKLVHALANQGTGRWQLRPQVKISIAAAQPPGSLTCPILETLVSGP